MKVLVKPEFSIEVNDAKHDIKMRNSSHLVA